MKGDFSRFTFDPRRLAHSLPMQQGRVQLDADLNEMQAVQNHRVETETIDVVGKTGYPKDTGGFGMSVGAGNQILIGKGRYYVDGLLVENYGDPAGNGLPVTSQEHLPGVAPPSTAGLYLAYLDVFLLNRTVLDMPEIREVALNGVDTATREQVAWQVKFLRVGDHDPTATCATPMPVWDTLDGLTSGTLAARARFGTATDDPCTLEPGAAFRGTENQLYRVEIHQGGPAATATFKWSRNNGSVVATWNETIGAQQIRVGSVGQGGLPGFAAKQWVELTDDQNELYDDTDALVANPPDLKGRPGTLVRIAQVDGNDLTLESAPGVRGTHNPKVRAWDMTTDAGGAIPVSECDPVDGFYELEKGVQVKFDQAVNCVYVAGDYWLIPARTLTADVDWPKPGGVPAALPPQGVLHHRARLGVLSTADGANWVVLDDCRDAFPSLTTICAEDVCFDDTSCQLGGATTVQDAIDSLCQMRGDFCTHLVVPGPGWEKVFDGIAPGADAHVCFLPGDYAVDQPVTIEKRGHVVLTGSGAGTRLSVKEGESVLVFRACESVKARDLSVEGGQIKPNGESHLGGALMTQDCPEVTVEHVLARAMPHTSRQVSCLNIGAAENVDGVVESPVSVRIAHCDLIVGDFQIGMLLTNVARAQITDSTIRQDPQQAAEDLRVWLEDPHALGQFRRLLFSHASFNTVPAATPGHASVTVTRGDFNLHFLTPNELEGIWDTAMGNAARSPKQLHNEAIRTVNRLLLEGDQSDQGILVQGWLTGLLKVHRPAGSEAIVLGGRVVTEARIHDNTVEGFVQGIRVGVSHRRSDAETEAGRPAARDIAGRISIEQNTIELSVPNLGVRDRYGIYTGNVDSAIINGNYINAETERQKGLPLAGIHLYGEFGRRMIVRENHIEGCTIGIRFHPLNAVGAEKSRRFQWLVTDNLALSAAPALQIEPVPGDGRVLQANNVS